MLRFMTLERTRIRWQAIIACYRAPQRLFVKMARSSWPVGVKLRKKLANSSAGNIIKPEYMGTIKDFIKHHYRHFNSAVVIDAA